MISARNAPLRADRYRDPLTDYLEGQSYQGFENSFARDHWNRRSEASLLLKQAIQELMSHHYSGPSSEWSLLRAYKDLLHSVAHHTTTRLGHMGLISLVSESRFRSLHGVDIWSKTVLAVRQEVDARSSRPKDALDLTNIPEVLEYVSVQLRSDLGKMCAIAANSAWSPMTRWTGRFSDWYLTITASSEHTKYIARSLHSQKSVQPGSIAYRQAISSLLHDREYDLAVALHCRVYVLEGVKSPGRDNVQIPDQEDLGRLVHALTTSSRDPRDIDRAQWIVDQYLQREESLHGSEQDVNKTCVLNTQIATMLAGAWSRCAEFTKVRRITDTMQRYGIQPNMVFYNTFLQALVDLAPFSRNGRRTTGSGKQAGMRELGREMMVRQLIHSRQRGDHVASEETQGEHVRSGLDVGWNLFQDIVSRSLRRPPQGLSSISRGLDSPSILKKLIVQTRPSLELSRSGFTGPEDGVFRPDAFTFSILLGAFARRGEIEPISELFVEMKQLGLEPDTAICTILANAFAKKGDLRSVDRVVQEARNRNLDPGLYLANVILNGLVEANVSASKIRESLDGMVVKAVEAEMATLDNETEIPVRKVEHPWPHLHEHRHRHQHRYENADSRNHSRSGDRILNRSSGQNGHSLGVDDVSLTTLIKYHVRQGDLESAQDVFETMLQAGLIPGKHVYALLMGACIRKKDILAGLSMIRAMRTQSMFFPDAKAWKGLLRCALELEKHGMPKDTKMINWSLNGFQHSAASIAARFVQDPRSRPQQLNRGPVVLVLEELSVVLHEINMARTLPAPRPRGCESERAGFNASLAAKDYLLGILRSSWVPPSDNKSKHDSPAVDGSTVVVNIDIKGKNGLLRRLLDHLLRGSSVSDLGTSEDDMENQSLVGRESTVEIEQRCEEAVWLVRLVEASRIELGPRWKWDVVVRRMQSLTGEDPRSIVKRLNKKKDDYRRKDE
ncbi:hypothetical protein BGX28_008953 [Mortierella sp. GBA30]|nr:hypothetical protein BGX28_008953 [Mortierella sp. GBA30]